MTWIDEEEDDLARGVLEAAGGDEAGPHAWMILLNLDRPPSERGQSGEAT